MKRFYSVILLLSISLTTVAQTSNYNNEFEAKLLRVFEWVLEARFSTAQRQELSRLVDSSIRANDASDLKAFQDIAKLNDLIDAIPPEREAETRAAIQANILKELRKQPDDPAAKLLLAVYSGARVQDSSDLSRVSSSGRQHDAHSAGAPTATTVPAELVGEWQARRGSGSSYYNPNSGSYSAPNATIDSYKFFADGTYEHAILMTNSLYNCTIRVFGRETGKAWIAGNRLTITPGPGTLEYTDTCRPQMNSKKATQMDQKKWQWEIGRDEQGLKLCVRDDQGASACYYRQ